MRELTMNEMKAVGGGDVIIITASRPQQSYWEKQMIYDMMSEPGVGEGGGFSSIDSPVNINVDIILDLNEAFEQIKEALATDADARENDPNNDFDRDKVTAVEAWGEKNGQLEITTVYRDNDDPTVYWMDTDNDGTPDLKTKSFPGFPGGIAELWADTDFNGTYETRIG